MSSEIALLRKQIGLEHLDQQLFEKALTHRSVGSSNNERLEFLGDSILGFVIAEALYKQFPDASEGELSRLRARMVNQESLASIAKELKFGDFLILGAGERKSGGFRRASLLSDAVEAVIGAIFLHKGITEARDWVLQLFSNRLNSLTLAAGQKDPKTRLQEKMQSRGLPLPVYELLSTSGAAHQQAFKVECQISLLDEPVTGDGSSRKKAEQQAAEMALLQLEMPAQDN